MKKDRVNLMFLIPNKTTIKLICILLLILYICLYINYRNEEDEDYLKYFYSIGIKEQDQYLEIDPERSAKLINYFINQKGDTDKAKFWNQICLFFETKYCKSLTLFWGLKEDHNNIRKEYFLEGKDDLHLLVEGDKNTAENRCYVVFYKAQNDLDKNKREFLNNYPICKEYYIQNIPALVEYENSFLQIMAF